MSKPMNYYWQLPLVRSLEDIIECARKQTFSCIHAPLLRIDVKNIVLDELHLMLRVTGKNSKFNFNVSLTFMYQSVLPRGIRHTHRTQLQIHPFDQEFHYYIYESQRVEN